MTVTSWWPETKLGVVSEGKGPGARSDTQGVSMTRQVHSGDPLEGSKANQDGHWFGCHALCQAEESQPR